MPTTPAPITVLCDMQMRKPGLVMCTTAVQIILDREGEHAGRITP